MFTGGSPQMLCVHTQQQEAFSATGDSSTLVFASSTSVGTADTSLDPNTSKYSLVVRRRCKAFPRNNRKSMLSKGLQMQSVFAPQPKAKDDTQNTELTAECVRCKLAFRRSCRPNAPSAAPDDFAPTVLAVMRQALTSDPGQTSTTSPGTVGTSTAFCAVWLVGICCCNTNVTSTILSMRWPCGTSTVLCTF